jgi:hypothetical protein
MGWRRKYRAPFPVTALMAPGGAVGTPLHFTLQALSGGSRQLSAAYSILRVVRLVIEGCPSLVVDDQHALTLVQQARGGCCRLADQGFSPRGTLLRVACTR